MVAACCLDGHAFCLTFLRGAFSGQARKAQQCFLCVSVSLNSLVASQIPSSIFICTAPVLVWLQLLVCQVMQQALVVQLGQGQSVDTTHSSLSPREGATMAESQDQEALMHLLDSSSAESLPEFSIDRFPRSIVWTPLPIVSWLAPFLGHVGVCREDGIILDFAGSYYVNIDSFAFGAAARFVHLDWQQCCFPPYLSRHTCKSGFEHAQAGTALSWDDGLRSCMQHFQHQSYNPFTCNCHSFVSCFLNRIAYQGSIDWSVITIVFLIFSKGQWVSKWAVAKAFAPFTSVMCLGLFVAGWSFLAGLAMFDLLLIGWFIFATRVWRDLVDC